MGEPKISFASIAVSNGVGEPKTSGADYFECTWHCPPMQGCASVSVRDVPVSGRHGDTALIGTARSGTGADTARHGPTRSGMARPGLADRSEGSGQ